MQLTGSTPQARCDMAERVYLLFKSATPGVEKTYFHRISEVGSGDRGQPPKTQVIVSTTVEDATGFSPEHAITARDGFRKQNYDCWIESVGGQRLYDNHESAPVVEAQPVHHTCFVPVGRWCATRSWIHRAAQPTRGLVYP